MRDADELAARSGDEAAVLVAAEGVLAHEARAVAHMQQGQRRERVARPDADLLASEVRALRRQTGAARAAWADAARTPDPRTPSWR